MKRLLFIVSIPVIIYFFIFSTEARAELRLGDGVVLTLNDSVLLLECSDLIITNGGELDLNNGRITNCRNVTIENGAIFYDDNGAISFNGLWTNDSSFIQSMFSIFEMTNTCGLLNSVAGYGDTDGDGIPDYWEEERGLDPFGNDASDDHDNDSLENLEEYVNNTDPFNADTDNDSYSDGAEVYHGTDPLVAENSLPTGMIIYVKSDSEGLSNGNSWENAFTDLESAFETALAGDQIWISAGTYQPDQGILSDPREASFRFPSGVSMYGGFSGVETIVEDRDPIVNETIISGDIGIEDDPSDNVYHVFFFNEDDALDTTALIDGVTITGGNANGIGVNNCGGAMYTKESSPKLSQIQFKRNNAEFGGALYSENAGPELSSCIFVNNTAVKSGGGLQCDNSTPIVSNSVFSNNIAGSSGGGIDSYKSDITLNNSLFFNNDAQLLGGAVNAYDSDIIITGCTLTQNKTIDNGGGLSAISGALEISSSIIYENTPDEIQALTDSTNISYSCISEIYDGVGNIDDNPIFTDVENGDFSLSAESPCINTGDPSASESTYGLMDITGRTRISCITVDIGAFELEDPICSELAQTSDKSGGGDGLCFISMLNENIPSFYTALILTLVVVIGIRTRKNLSI